MSEVLLSLQGVSKSYGQSAQASSRARAFWQILTQGQAPAGKSVVEDIDLEVLRGQSVGIIGANGAGKSTLLKLITGVLAPSQGRIETHGSTAALLELGAGFDPEYTGLENLHMNAAFLGLTRPQIAEHLDEIVAFADIGDAIHEPVKHYSSGMVVRLGFAVVAAVKPDLLITDEVLAVGDESFQKKCIRWIEGYLADGGTLLMVSHNMYQVQKLCQHALWLDAGAIRAQGDVFDVTQRYLAYHERKDSQTQTQPSKTGVKAPYALTELSVNGETTGEPVVGFGQTLTVAAHIESPDGRPPVVMVGVVRAAGTPVYGVATDHDGIQLKLNTDGQAVVHCTFEQLQLLPGGYRIKAHTLDPEGLRVHDTAEVPVTVSGKTRELGMARLAHHWSQSDLPSVPQS